MEFRPLGKSGISIAPLVFGGNVFGWTADEPISFTLLDAFVDGGFNTIDTADAYSRWVEGHTGGESETIIGNWLKKSGKRNKVVIATKAGADMGEGKCVKKDYILRAAEASLKRLQIDTIDLYQTHWDDDVTPVEETLAAYAQLIKDGKVRAIGASNVTPERLNASLRRPARRKTCRATKRCSRTTISTTARATSATTSRSRSKQRLAVIPYYALAAGFLTGKYKTKDEAEKSARGFKVKNYFDARGVAILKALGEVAARHNATPAQIALAWLIARPSITAPIASATSVKQLQDIMKAPRLKLTKDDVAALDKASA